MLSLADVTVTEGADVEFEVSLGAASELEVTVAYATADDTAEEPDDYTSASGTLTFEAGDRAKTITVTTENDDAGRRGQRAVQADAAAVRTTRRCSEARRSLLEVTGTIRRQRRSSGAVAGGRDGDRRCGCGVRGEPGERRANVR